MKPVYGAFILPKTETDTDTDKMGAEPSGNLSLYLSLWSVNTAQFFTSQFMS